jgi:hypothetical protein
LEEGEDGEEELNSCTVIDRVSSGVFMHSPVIELTVMHISI